MDPNIIHTYSYDYWLPATQGLFDSYSRPPLYVQQLPPATALIPVNLRNNMGQSVPNINTKPPRKATKQRITTGRPIGYRPSTGFAPVASRPLLQPPGMMIPTYGYPFGQLLPPEILPGMCVRYNPTLRDVVSGNGKPLVRWATNRWYLSLVEHRMEQYRAAQKKSERRQIIDGIVATILNSGGRFLQWKSYGVWTVCSSKMARTTTGHMMQCRAYPGNKEKSSPSKDTNSGTVPTTPPTPTTTKNAQPNVKDQGTDTTNSCGTNKRKVCDIDTNNGGTKRTRLINKEPCQPCENEDGNSTPSDVSSGVYPRTVPLVDPKADDDYDNFPHYRSNIEDDVDNDESSGCTIPRSILQNLEFCSEYSVSSHILWFSPRILWFSAQVYVVVHGFPECHHRFPGLYSDFCSDVVNMNKFARLSDANHRIPNCLCSY